MFNVHKCVKLSDSAKQNKHETLIMRNNIFIYDLSKQNCNHELLTIVMVLISAKRLSNKSLLLTFMCIFM